MTQDLALRLVAESSSSILKRLAILRHKYILNDGNLMADKFKPLNYNPRFVYDADYWNIVFQDAYHFF
jgi:hypothetical protein